MELNEKQYQRIAGLLPIQRGNVKIPNHTLLNALIYRCENGCKWRALPKPFGDWHVIYVRLNRWSENGVLDRVYAALSSEGLLDMSVCSLDSMAVKAHPDAHGAQQKRHPSDRKELRGLEHQYPCGYGRRAVGSEVRTVYRERCGYEGGPDVAGKHRAIGPDG